MSTRCVINFCYDESPQAKVYRHSDGYPDGILPDIQQFFADVQTQTSDTRFGDPTYLAAKYVVWQADQYHREGGMLNFTSVGVCLENPGDLEYEYFVHCSTHDKVPTITYTSVR